MTGELWEQNATPQRARLLSRNTQFTSKGTLALREAALYVTATDALKIQSHTAALSLSQPCRRYVTRNLSWHGVVHSTLVGGRCWASLTEGIPCQYRRAFGISKQKKTDLPGRTLLPPALKLPVAPTEAEVCWKLWHVSCGHQFCTRNLAYSQHYLVIDTKSLAKPRTEIQKSLASQFAKRISVPPAKLTGTHHTCSAFL